MTTLHLCPLSLPGSLPSENPFPVFRDRNPHRTVLFQQSVEARYRELAGWNTGARVLPYCVQDRYDRRKERQVLPSVVLENEFLRACFLPDQGGRLWSLIYKPTQRELLARNEVIQPANLAVRNAWFSGGIEWNIGQYGHTVFTCAPVFSARIRYSDESPGLRIYEFERMTKLFWQTDFFLPHRSDLLIAHTRVLNPFDEEASLYWWTNIAVSEGADVRVIMPGDQALYIAQPQGGFGQATLPLLPSLGGRDGTYAVNSAFANEYFVQCEGAEPPFVAALDRAGTGLFEASTPRLNVRKQFCWGMHQGGRRWQEFLSQPATPYIEIQAGLAPTQLHGRILPPQTQWDWTEVFGYLEADPARVHSSDWSEATSAAASVVAAKVSAARLARIQADCRRQVDVPSGAIIRSGTGWGALELRRRAAQGGGQIPEAFVFPDESLTGEPARWLPLLSGGVFPAAAPGAWMVQSEWRDLLAASLTRVDGSNWEALLHLGVMLYEAFDETGAARAWRESIAVQPSVWAWRNLGVLAQTRREFRAARAHYDWAWRMSGSLDDTDQTSLAREFMQLLVAAEDCSAALQFYSQLRPLHQDDDGVQIARAWAALHLGDFNTVDQILQRDFVTIREGDVSLTEIWFEMKARRDADGRPVSAEIRRRTRTFHPPPARIDFRAFTP